MDYQQTLDYLFSQLPMYHRVGVAAYKPDLVNTLEICNLLNNPQHGFKSIHIAGTNGKGSVSHFLSSIFQENGFKTGLYTSPHIKDFRERIRINGNMISEKHVIEFIEKYKHGFEKIKPSFFEWTVGLAFDYFRNEKVDIAIIETGLGGRLDSTNVITPELSIITNISWDHSNLLGETLEKIAVEKAGIIKNKVPVVIGETQQFSSGIFQTKAKEINSEIFFADQLFTSENCIQHFGENPYLKLSVEPIDKADSSIFFNKNLELKSELTGIYQVKNIITVCAVIQALKAKGYILNKKNIVSGFEKVIRNTGILGRWQKLADKPLTFCDTGHNEGGILEILSQLKKMKYHKLHWVFGMVNDKDISKILSILPHDARYYFCKAGVQRALNDVVLQDAAQKFYLKGTAFGSVVNAFQAAMNAAQKNDLILVSGSTFVVAEVL